MPTPTTPTTEPYDQLTFECLPAGDRAGKLHRVLTRRQGEAIHIDVIDLTRASDRSTYTMGLHRSLETLGVDAPYDALRLALVRVADQLAQTPGTTPAPSPGTTSGTAPGTPDGDPAAADGSNTLSNNKLEIKNHKSPGPAAVFTNLLNLLTRHVDFGDARQAGPLATTVALWVMLTYVSDAWEAVPYLFINGPAESGKTRLLNVLERLCLNPLSSASLSSAAMFRTLHQRGGTLLLDEADSLLHKAGSSRDLLTLLVAGYKRGARATRMDLASSRVGEYPNPAGSSALSSPPNQKSQISNQKSLPSSRAAPAGPSNSPSKASHQPSLRLMEFSVFGPKALASIGALPPALAARCIAVPMQRAGADSPLLERRLDDDAPPWQAARDDLSALAREHAQTWVTLAGRPGLCPTMSGRERELWQPLLALASWLDEQVAPGFRPVSDSAPQAAPDVPVPTPGFRPVSDSASQAAPEVPVPTPGFRPVSDSASQAAPEVPVPTPGFRPVSDSAPQAAPEVPVPTPGGSPVPPSSAPSQPSLVAQVRGRAMEMMGWARQDKTPEADEVLLRALARLTLAGEAPTPMEVLRAAREEDPAAIRPLGGNPRAAAVVLRRYGLWSSHSGQRRYVGITPDRLRQVQNRYHIDLDLPSAPQVLISV